MGSARPPGDEVVILRPGVDQYEHRKERHTAYWVWKRSLLAEGNKPELHDRQQEDSEMEEDVAGDGYVIEY